MSYCLNPNCDRQNPSDAKLCQHCGSQLLLVDRYRAISLIGQGGFGRTLLSVDESETTKPRCVIKQFAPQGQGNIAKAIELFQQEAMQLNDLGKQNQQIPKFLAYHEQNGCQYLVQEFIEGQNLAQELAESGVFSAVKIRELLHNLLPVLQFIHAKGVIHRDIKPENIIHRRVDRAKGGVEGQNLAQELAESGVLSAVKNRGLLQNLLPVTQFIHAKGVIHRDIKLENIIHRRVDRAKGGVELSGDLVLVDFGAAKHATGTALLKTGTSIGSAEYTAPEQARGKAVFASDLYSLGVTCIHLLTQVSPFDMVDGNNNWVWRDWLKGHPVDPKLGQILDKLIAPAVSQRYTSATEVLQDLDLPHLISQSIQPKKDVPRRIFFRKTIVITAITAFGIGAFAAFQTLPRLIAQANEAKQSAARAYVGIMNRGQQAFYSEKNTFGSTLDELGIGIRPGEVENYSYTIIRVKETKVQQVGLAKQEGLKSYTGILFKIDGNNIDANTNALLCESDQPTTQMPPEFDVSASGHAKCPQGYSPVGN